MMTIHRNRVRRMFSGIVVVAFALTAAGPSVAAWLDGAKEVKIGDRTYPISRDKNVMRLAFAHKTVPDDQNAAIEYVEAINGYVKPPKGTDTEIKTWTEESKSLLPWLEKNADAMALVRRAAKKSDCKFPLLKEPGEPLIAVLLPHLSPMRELARLLIAHGKYLESQKKYGEAIDDYLAVRKMGYHVSREPILISGLVGIACESLAAQAIEGCVQSKDIDLDTLRDLLVRLGVSSSSADNYGMAISGEKAFGPATLDDLFDSPRRLNLSDIAGDGDNFSSTLFYLAGRIRGFRAAMRADFRRYWKAMDTWNELPDHLAFKQENRFENEILDEMPLWSPAKVLLPALSGARKTFVRLKASNVLVRGEVALEIHRKELGNYPSSLSELKSLTGGELVDPFAGKPLQYRREGDGYVLYSINDNLVDDGGDGNLSTREGKDIVVRAPLR